MLVRGVWTGLVVVAMAALLGGCGPDCASTCDKLYGDAAGECDIQVPVTNGSVEDNRRELLSDCRAECNSAMTQAGELGDYNPDERPRNGQEVALENEVQAAAWMDCVSESSCDRISEGYCAPVRLP